MSTINPNTPTPSIQSGIYQIRNVISGKFYVGSAKNFNRRWNKHRRDLICGTHHNRHLLNAWRKHGPDAFEFEILEFVSDKSNLICKEQEWLDRLQPWRRTIGYNLWSVADSPAGRRLTKEHRAKIGAASLGRKRSPESIEKTAAVHRGAKRSAESRARMSAARKGEKRSQEVRDRMSVARKGKSVHTPESRSKISAAHKGRTHSDETKEKLGKAAKKQWENMSPEAKAAWIEKMRTRHRSAEERAKISESVKTRQPTQAQLDALRKSNQEKKRKAKERRESVSQLGLPFPD